MAASLPSCPERSSRANILLKYGVGSNPTTLSWEALEIILATATSVGPSGSDSSTLSGGLLKCEQGGCILIKGGHQFVEKEEVVLSSIGPQLIIAGGENAVMKSRALSSALRISTGGTSLIISCLSVLAEGEPARTRGRAAIPAKPAQSAVLVRNSEQVVLNNCYVFGGSKCGLLLSSNSEVKLLKGTIVDRSQGFGVSIGIHSLLYMEDSIVKLAQDTGIICSGKGSLLEATRSQILSCANCGVAVQDGGNGRLSHCEVKASGVSGVMAAGGAMCTVQDSIISGNTRHGVTVQEGSELTMLCCHVDHSSTGLFVTGDGTVCTVEHSHVERCDRGIVVQDSAQAVIRRNRIRRHAQEGINITGSRAEITKNRITRNGAEGIVLLRGGHSNLRDNRFDDKDKAGSKGTPYSMAVLIKDDAGGDMIAAACQRISNDLIAVMSQLDGMESQSDSSSLSSTNIELPEEFD